MVHEYTEAEKTAWLRSRPKKALSAKVVLYDDSGEMLITKPNYKPGWFFVGGMVDTGESPLRACIREAREEVGVELEAAQLRFIGMRYGVSKSGDDYIHLLFGATLSPAQKSQVQKLDPENDELKWVPPDNLADEIGEKTYGLFRQSRKNKKGYYSEQDDLFVPFEAN